MAAEQQTMKRIRIMHVTQAAGGVKRYLYSLIKYLDHDKFENILVCSKDYKEEEFHEIAEYIEQIDMQRSIGKWDLKAIRAVRKLIKRYKPDIVYAHSSKAGAIVRIANLGIKNKCIYNPHGWAFNMRESRRMQTVYSVLERMMSPFCDGIVCISEAEKRSALNKKVCSEEKLFVIVNGVDVKAYDKYKHNDISRTDIGIPEDVYVVGMVGRLCPQKAPDIFIEMAQRVRQKIPDAHFLIVGNGEMRNDIESYASKFEMLEVVHITGWVDNPLSYIELFDVAVLLSRWEGFGLAIPEYMMCKKPVVVTSVDAIPDIVSDHLNGLLVPMNDPDSACNAVMEIYNDVNLRDRLIAQGVKDIYKKYDVRRVSEEHGSLFHALMN